MPNTPVKYFNEDKITTRLYPGDREKLKARAKQKHSTVAEQARELIRKQLLMEEETNA